ncbi:hypothetical protein [Halobacterium jilantaiense]|uniref:Uncharacterized protein n=1 Tax=Halobacterium jilantaiense TaxID=355548 RepID=A0A1I0N690_9EURY|nr:hypothetical protein [Halobacterium jilantaiense]SEV96541.1 hypothetical protein SAMN04487945_0631 [Halobacterium jilantaiense]
MDADGSGGEEREIESAMHEHADGQPGTFKLYRDYHEQLQLEGGYYVFAAYRIRGRGVEALAHERRPASRLPTLRWHGGGEHRGTEQATIGIVCVRNIGLRLLSHPQSSAVSTHRKSQTRLLS